MSSNGRRPSRHSHSVKGHKHDCQVTFYPGFVSRVSVQRGTGEETVYAQSETAPDENLFPFNLDGEDVDRKKPRARHEFRFERPDGRQFGLEIHDPNDEIFEIVVRLKKRERPVRASAPAVEGTARADGGVHARQDPDEETVVIQSESAICPPTCTGTGTGGGG